MEILDLENNILTSTNIFFRPEFFDENPNIFLQIPSEFDLAKVMHRFQSHSATLEAKGAGVNKKVHLSCEYVNILKQNTSSSSYVSCISGDFLVMSNKRDVNSAPQAEIFDIRAR